MVTRRYGIGEVIDHRLVHYPLVISEMRNAKPVLRHIFTFSVKNFYFRLKDIIILVVIIVESRPHDTTDIKPMLDCGFLGKLIRLC